MKRVRVISSVTIIVAFVLIVIGYSISFVDGYSLDVKMSNAAANLIKNSYNSYAIDLEKISYQIKDTTVFDAKYYSDIKYRYEQNIKELKNIEEQIKALDTMTKKLRYECSARNYNDYDIDEKCSAINHNYEAIVNAYVSLVREYNRRIDDYNEWSDTDLKKYSTSFYDSYIDADSNGEHSGVIK